MRNSLNEDKDSGAPGSKLAGRKRSGNGVPDCRGSPRIILREITRPARLATSSAHIPERNILSRQDSRVTAPDSVSEAFVLDEFHQNPNPLPNLKADVSTPPKLAVRTVDSFLKSFQVRICFSRCLTVSCPVLPVQTSVIPSSRKHHRMMESGALLGPIRTVGGDVWEQRATSSKR